MKCLVSFVVCGLNLFTTFPPFNSSLLCVRNYGFKLVIFRHCWDYTLAVALFRKGSITYVTHKGNYNSACTFIDYFITTRIKVKCKTAGSAISIQQRKFSIKLQWLASRNLYVLEWEHIVMYEWVNATIRCSCNAPQSHTLATSGINTIETGVHCLDSQTDRWKVNCPPLLDLNSVGRGENKQIWTNW